jgi:hypothetical protein
MARTRGWGKADRVSVESPARVRGTDLRFCESRTYKGREVVDGDDGHGRVTLSNVDVDGRLGEDGVDFVDGERVVGVGGAERSKKDA